MLARLRHLGFQVLKGEVSDEGHMRSVIWVLALTLFVAWAVSKFAFGKSGFVHILLLCAVAVAVVQWVADRRAAQGRR